MLLSASESAQFELHEDTGEDTFWLNCVYFASNDIFKMASKCRKTGKTHLRKALVKCSVPSWRKRSLNMSNNQIIARKVCKQLLLGLRNTQTIVNRN